MESVTNSNMLRSFRVLLAPRISRSHFFFRGFLSRHARRTKRKRDYSWSMLLVSFLVFDHKMLKLGVIKSSTVWQPRSWALASISGSFVNLDPCLSLSFALVVEPGI